MTCGDLFFMLEAFLAWAIHEHFVSNVTLLSYPFIMSSFCPFFCGSRHFVWTFCWWELIVRWAGHFHVLSFSLYHSDNCMLFFHQPFLISIDSWLMSWGSLEMQTQVPPWLSSGVAESYSSLFVSDLPAVFMVKEETSSVLVWNLHCNSLGVRLA